MAENLTKQILESGWDEDANGKKWEDYDTIRVPSGKVIDMQNVIEEIYRAIASLTHLAPTYGGLISKLRIVYTFKVSTMATDGYNLFINPQFADELDFTGKVFVLAHEVMHCLLNHMRRAKAAGHHDHMKSNIAADYEVNASLVLTGLFKETTVTKLNALYDKKYNDMGYEKIYDIVNSSGGDSMDNSDQAQQAQKNQQGSGGGGGQQPKKQYSADFKDGWKAAIEAYKSGQLKL